MENNTKDKQIAKAKVKSFLLAMVLIIGLIVADGIVVFLGGESFARNHPFIFVSFIPVIVGFSFYRYLAKHFI